VPPVLRVSRDPDAVVPRTNARVTGSRCRERDLAMRVTVPRLRAIVYRGDRLAGILRSEAFTA